jgi:hypothetical protein
VFVHEPAAHVVCGHDASHEPQWAGSLSRFAQLSPQQTRSVAQMPHVPPSLASVDTTSIVSCGAPSSNAVSPASTLAPSPSTLVASRRSAASAVTDDS